MNKISNRLILFFAAIGLCAMIYSAWHYYQAATRRRSSAGNTSTTLSGRHVSNPNHHRATRTNYRISSNLR